jgi:arsenite-transporting ATPase
VTDPYYGKWREIQSEHLETIHQAFSPLPILKARLWDREIVGRDLLSALGAEIYQHHDPVQVLHQERPIHVAGDNGRYTLTIPVPFAAREELETWLSGEELIIRYKNFKRHLILPRTLVGRELIKAERKGKELALTFGGASS